MFKFKFSFFQKLIIVLCVISIISGGLIILNSMKPAKKGDADIEQNSIEKILNLEKPSPIKVVSQAETARLKEDIKVNINTATVDDLESVKGIGHVTAMTIVKYREKHKTDTGPVFYRLSDLTKIPRIGDKKVKKLSEYLTVGWDVMQTVREDPNAKKKGDKININTANAGELEELPRVGPATARAIVKYREEHGMFAAIEDIMQVPRIGQGTYNNFKDLITVGEEARRAAIIKKTLTKPKKQKKININKATLEQLQELQGVGPSTAQRIIDYRKEIRVFRSVDQLLDVPGIGEKTLERLRPHIDVR